MTSDYDKPRKAAEKWREALQNPLLDWENWADADGELGAAIRRRRLTERNRPLEYKDFVLRMLREGWQDTEANRREAADWNIDLALPRQVVAVSWEPLFRWKSVTHHWSPDMFSLMKDVNDIMICSETYRWLYLKAIDGECSCEDDRTEQTVTKIQELVRDAAPEKGFLAVGIGRSALEPGRISRSTVEAQKAMELGPWLDGETVYYTYGSITTTQVLAAVPFGHVSEKHLQAVPEVVARTDWLQTLRVFFMKGRNLRETGKRLQIHGNSVQYRLREIADYVDLDPRDYHEGAALHSALILHYLLK